MGDYSELIWPTLIVAIISVAVVLAAYYSRDYSRSKGINSENQPRKEVRPLEDEPLYKLEIVLNDGTKFLTKTFCHFHWSKHPKLSSTSYDLCERGVKGVYRDGFVYRGDETFPISKVAQINIVETENWKEIPYEDRFI